MTRLIVAVVTVAMLVGSSATPLAQGGSEEARRVREAATVFGEIMAAEDKAIPRVLHELS